MSRRVLFVTTGLGVGGAERALERLVPRLQAQSLICAVVSLRETQEIGGALRAAGVEVFELGMAPSRPSLRGLWRLWQVVRTFKPDVIQGWMYHGNLAAQFARLAAPHARVVLGIHQTLARLELEGRATRAVIRLDALLSRFAAKILYVAQAAVAQHQAAGYAARAVVLPNGVDTDLYRPDAADRTATRAMLGIPDATVLVGMVGRLHPAKNHAGFLRAAGLAAQTYPELHFVLIGLGVTAQAPELAPLLAEPALAGRVSLLGARDDVPRLMPALDLYVLSSIQEALPNVVAEAMSCGVPCVVTDVGDAAWMVADTGWVVAPEDDEALAEVIERAVAEGASSLAARGRAARSRAQSLFAVDVVTARYAALYQSLARS
jgi:glycosyltransferase involved in cell wall biosynthesis